MQKNASVVVGKTPCGVCGRCSASVIHGVAVCPKHNEEGGVVVKSASDALSEFQNQTHQSIEELLSKSSEK